MDTTTLFKYALVKATGKVKQVSEGTPAWDALLATANMMIDSWGNEPSVNWESLWDEQEGVYTKPKHLAKGRDKVPVDDPNWLVLMVAADYARAKRTLAHKYPLFIAEADNAMNGMKEANQLKATDMTVTRGRVATATEW